MDFNATMLTNFAREFETLTPFGSLFVIFLLSLIINYRLFKGRMEDCAKDKERILEKLDNFKESLDELKLEIRSKK
ncbi:hypothetical protein [Campylobacter estrildidarum]|uniref:Uncharacterized protein n=1 Tax=Campylobacter estrildidarum TaxID=2510189 RepID=A0A4U7BK69_9BACT|nr:hypothetical protein [Campylobacter estrildidarum]TKX30490.1 hypothetical protein CQA69_06330 [Campylobacter estrildidarum]